MEHLLLKLRSHLRDCRPRLRTTEHFLDSRTQSYWSLTAVVGIRTGILLSLTQSYSVALSLGETATVLKISKQSYGSLGSQLIRTAYVLQSYGSRGQSYWFLLVRMAVFPSPTESYDSLTAVAASPTDSY